MRPALLPRSLAAGLVLLASTAVTALADDGRYGYYRVIEGTADVVRTDGTEAAQENAPLLSGDRLWTGRGSRAEVELPDGTLVRVGGDTEVTFDELARSNDGTAGGTMLYLARGEVQVVTDNTAGVAEYPRVDTPNATVYLEGAGSYRIETGGDASGLVVRRGQAEIVTQRGTTPVAAGEEAWVEGSSRAAVQVAGAHTALERWGAELEDTYRRARVEPGVDRSLAYASSRMDGYGSWVSVESRRGWRPRVGADWSPYRHGRWQYTPSGLTWVSYEPWGWVPYHYGSWDFAPGYGWVWYPGRAYAPAWVYWYWGPSHVGWVPIGYYYRHYGPRYYNDWGWGWGSGFHFGIHGWAGGRIGYWDRWNFVDCRYFGDRRLSSYTRYAHQLGVGELPRGVIATDTRPLRGAIATRPAEGMRALAGHPTRGEGRDLPDVTRFIARDPGAPADAVRRALPIEPSGGARTGGDGRGAVGIDTGSPRALPSRPTTAGPRAGGRGTVGAVPGEPIGSGRSDDTRPQARPRSGAPAGGGDSVGARPSPPARSTPGGPGDGGGAVSRPTDRGGIRVLPGKPDETPGRGAVTVRPVAPTRAAPPPDRGISARPSAPTRTSPPPRSSDGDTAVPQRRDDGRQPNATPRAYAPPPASGNDSGSRGSTGTRPRALPTDDWRQPGSRTVIVPRTAPPSGSGRVEPGGSSPRTVPPVRRVVEGVRGSRYGGSDSYAPPPSSRPPAVGSAPSSGSTTRYASPARPSAPSRGGYVAPPPTSSGPSRGGYVAPPPAASGPSPQAPSRSTAGSPPDRGPSRSAAPPGGQSSGRSSGSSGSRGGDGAGSSRGSARSSSGDGDGGPNR